MSYSSCVVGIHNPRVHGYVWQAARHTLRGLEQVGALETHGKQQNNVSSSKAFQGSYAQWWLRSASQHRHDGVAGLAFAGFVDGEDAVFPFLAALLIGERDFTFDGHSGVGPGAV